MGGVSPIESQRLRNIRGATELQGLSRTLLRDVGGELVVELRRHDVVAARLLACSMLFGGARVVLPGIGCFAYRALVSGASVSAMIRSNRSISPSSRSIRGMKSGSWSAAAAR